MDNYIELQKMRLVLLRLKAEALWLRTYNKWLSFLAWISGRSPLWLDRIIFYRVVRRIEREYEAWKLDPANAGRSPAEAREDIRRKEVKRQEQLRKQRLERLRRRYQNYDRE